MKHKQSKPDKQDLAIREAQLTAKEGMADQLGAHEFNALSPMPRESQPDWLREWIVAGRVDSLARTIKGKQRLIDSGKKGGAPKQEKNEDKPPRFDRVKKFGRRVDELLQISAGKDITKAVDQTATEQSIGPSVRWDYWRDFNDMKRTGELKAIE